MIRAKEQAEAAINSVRDARCGKDGISYLINLISKEVSTKLTEQYQLEILNLTQTTTLSEALQKSRYEQPGMTVTSIKLNPGKMTEAEVSLRLAIFFAEHPDISGHIIVAIDGAQVKVKEKIIFPLFDFMRDCGWAKPAGPD